MMDAGNFARRRKRNLSQDRNKQAYSRALYENPIKIPLTPLNPMDEEDYCGLRRDRERDYAKKRQMFVRSYRFTSKRTVAQKFRASFRMAKVVVWRVLTLRYCSYLASRLRRFERLKSAHVGCPYFWPALRLRHCFRMSFVRVWRCERWTVVVDYGTEKSMSFYMQRLAFVYLQSLAQMQISRKECPKTSVFPALSSELTGRDSFSPSCDRSSIFSETSVRIPFSPLEKVFTSNDEYYSRLKKRREEDYSKKRQMFVRSYQFTTEKSEAARVEPSSEKFKEVLSKSVACTGNQTLGCCVKMDGIRIRAEKLGYLFGLSLGVFFDLAFGRQTEKSRAHKEFEAWVESQRKRKV
ncbi:hypothetical protein SUGI_0343100 [Cryptomeria japonica]|nr:hypothetical protein SUGI_0343100 [Cryptomeria japonica]